MKFRNAANRIRTAWYSHLFRKKIKPIILQRRKSAIIIQRSYRMFRFLNMTKKLKFKSAQMVQKFMRGYKVKQRYHMIVFEGRVLRDIDKFSCNNE